MKKPVKKTFQSMSSDHVLNLLRNNHTTDVFVSECKNGSSQGSHARLDAWVMNKSWTRLCFTGYEIKVSRNDFKQDEKWHAYLPLCNQLYFVCPKGMIEPEEIPSGIGLKYATQGRILIAKKAEHRDIRPPMELFVYILMCRSKISRNEFGASCEIKEEDRLRRYREFLNQKKEARDIGEVIRRETSSRIYKVESENKMLKSRIDKAIEIEGVIRRAGINRWDSEDEIKRKALEYFSGVPKEFISDVERLKHSCSELLHQVELLKKQNAA